MKGNDYYTKALLELALINANARRYDRAIEYYKTVVTAAPDSPEADDALAGLESIYQIRHQPEEFLTYLEEIGRSDIKSDAEKEQMLFNSAQQIYHSGRYTAAISALQRYLAQYPLGEKAAMATFYLAESLRATGRLESAADSYLKVVRMGSSPCQEDALAAYAAINYDLQHYKQAMDAYEQLIGMTRSDSVRLVETLITGSPAFFKKKSEKQIREFFEHALDFLKQLGHQHRVFST